MKAHPTTTTPAKRGRTSTDLTAPALLVLAGEDPDDVDEVDDDLEVLEELREPLSAPVAVAEAATPD